MRRESLILILLLTSTLTACSYFTDFVVVNESDHPIDVGYRYKHFPGDKPFELYVPPSKIAAQRLSSKGGNEWQQLTPSDYQLDRENRTVLVRVMPREAIRIYSFHNYRGHDDAQGQGYPFEEFRCLGLAAE